MNHSIVGTQHTEIYQDVSYISWIQSSIAHIDFIDHTAIIGPYQNRQALYPIGQDHLQSNFRAILASLGYRDGGLYSVCNIPAKFPLFSMVGLCAKLQEIFSNLILNLF
jgi:hypothetical protein